MEKVLNDYTSVIVDDGNIIVTSFKKNKKWCVLTSVSYNGERLVVLVDKSKIIKVKNNEKELYSYARNYMEYWFYGEEAKRRVERLSIIKKVIEQ